MSERGASPQGVRSHRDQAAPAGALLCIGAAALAAIATLLNLYSGPWQDSAQPWQVVFTAWEQRVEPRPGKVEPLFGAGVPNGIPMLAGAAVLLAAGVLVLLGARRSTPRLARAGGLAAVAGAAFLAGTAGSVAVQEWWWLDVHPSPDIVTRVGLGFWTLVAAAALAVAAAVVIGRRARPDRLATPRRGRLAAASALLCVGAAALTVIGTLLKLYVRGFDPYHMEPWTAPVMVITAWERRAHYTTGAIYPGSISSLPNGVPLLAGAAVLLAAAVLVLLGTRRSLPRLGRAGGVATVVGAAFLVATVGSVGVQELYWLDLFPATNPEAGTSIGPGFWALVAAAVLAVAAAVVWGASGRGRAILRV